MIETIGSIAPTIAAVLVAVVLGMFIGWCFSRPEVDKLKADKQALRERYAQAVYSSSKTVAEAHRRAIDRERATQIEKDDFMRAVREAELRADIYKKGAGARK